MRQIQRYPIWIYDVTVTLKPGFSFDWHGNRILGPGLVKHFTSSIHVSKVICEEHAFSCEFLCQLWSGACMFCTLHDEIKKSYSYNKTKIRKRIGFVNNLTIKHCDRTKVKTITVKNSKNSKKKLSDNFKKRRRFLKFSDSF